LEFEARTSPPRPGYQAGFAEGAVESMTKKILRRFPRLIRYAVICALAAHSLRAALPGRAPGGASKSLAVQVVAYRIDARLDPSTKTIAATEILTYHNLTGHALELFPFHLYLNAFQPTSTFMREVRLSGTRGTGPDEGWDPRHYGSIEVESFEVVGQGDLTKQMHFVQPDDTPGFRNPDDHTVFQVRLPKPIPPGADVVFKIAFRDRLPEVLERTGYKRNFYMVGQWFPKVGVWWHDAWNCHQFHASSEFFADFGAFEVKITVPQKFVLGATGDLMASVNNSDGTKTVTWHAEDIHDFAFTADPEYVRVEDSWTGSAGTVKIHVLMQPHHMRQAGRYLQALKGALDRFDKWYGPYPYDRITVVDPAHGAMEAGGMEYPTLITAGTSWWDARGLRDPEVVVEHEFGHQYWYGMVATNEFEEAWLDEGINSYTEVKIMDSLYGMGRDLVDLWGATADDAGFERRFYLAEPDTDPLTRHAWQYMNSRAYGAVTYGKTACVLLTLEGFLGEENMRRVLHTYFMRYRFTHPTGEDFLKTIEEVTGQDLRWYFDQAVRGTNTLDYEVADLRSDRLDWYAANAPPERKGRTVYRDSVLVQRKGDFVLPVQVKVAFDNGESVREHWDGRDRWVRFSYERKAKLVSAEVDPDHLVWLDSNFFNNSRTQEPHTAARRKLTTYWLFLTQWFEQALGWLV
jgi:hypothetical protein